MNSSGDKPGRSGADVDAVFSGAPVVHSADDLAVEGLFEPGEVEAFLADLYVMRRRDG